MPLFIKGLYHYKARINFPPKRIFFQRLKKLEPDKSCGYFDSSNQDEKGQSVFIWRNLICFSRAFLAAN
jgi:hypothetical protein